MTDIDADLREVYAHIMARAPEHDIDPTRERVQRVLELLGDPHRAYRVIHVTGTNGKTSTARMTERLIREHGLRTGMFTSPHLASVTERICIDGEQVSPERFIEIWHDVEPYIAMVDAASATDGGPRLSFFEVLTVMAFAAFADAPVDVAVIEVGMGGQWDATNVADGDVAILTPIALDHERWLGHSVAQIAREKAGIIKDRSTVVMAEQQPDADIVVTERAQELGVRLLREGDELAVAGRRLAVGGQVIDLRTAGGYYTEIFLPLHGEHQARNALLALAAGEALLTGGRVLGAQAVEAAFAGASSPGRLELVRSSPTILVDAAHNPAGAEALVAALDEAFDFHRLVAVVAVMADKDAENLLAVLEPVVADIVITRNSAERCAELDDLTEIAHDVFGEDRVHAVEQFDEAIQVAVDLAEAGDDLGVGMGVGVLVTGSVVTAADARALLARREHVRHRSRLQFDGT